MKRFLIAVAAICGLSSAQDDGNTARIDLAVRKPAGTHNASNFLYGIPLNFNPNQIPDHFYTDIGITYTRAGGGQLEAPCRGWAFGVNEYQCRLNAVILNYKQTRKFGAKFMLLPMDLWGVDYKDQANPYKFPGDNGDWSSYDAFLNQLISDLKANNLLPGVIWDIWNEPDISGFWQRSIQQWVDLYIRTHKRVRRDTALNSVLLSGPTLANSPNIDDPYWRVWGPQVAGNRTYPDQYVWHYEIGGDSSDPDISDALFHQLLNTYGLPFRPVNINEYATLPEETPSGYAWWISRLERYNYAGLLGIWNPPLYDNFAGLLTKSPGDPQDPSNTNYVGAAGFYLYKYYASSMIGTRAKTIGSTNRQFDTFVTVGARGDKVRILAGSRAVTGNYTINIAGLTSVGYPAQGTLNAEYYAFYGTDNIFDPAGEPPFLGVQSVPIVNGVANLNVFVPDKHTGWRIEFPRL